VPRQPAQGYDQDAPARGVERIELVGRRLSMHIDALPVGAARPLPQRGGLGRGGGRRGGGGRRTDQQHRSERLDAASISLEHSGGVGGMLLAPEDLDAGAIALQQRTLLDLEVADAHAPGDAKIATRHAPTRGIERLPRSA